MNTDQEIEMQCMEAEQMIIEHDISQRKKKKKNKKNENLSFPIDEDEDLQEKMKKKNENPSFPIDEDERTGFRFSFTISKQIYHSYKRIWWC